MSDSEEETTRQKQLKIIVVGETAVGKTSVIRRFCFDEFTRHYNQTVGADFYMKRLLFPGKQEVAVKISDVGGLELRGHMLPNYMFNCNIIVMVYDITNSVSFECMHIWYQAMLKINEKAPIFAFIGNKCDLEHQRSVRLDKTKDFIDDFSVLHYLVSAKTGEGVHLCFMEMIAKYFNIPLSRVQKEQQQPIVKAEIIPNTPHPIKVNTLHRSNSSVCSLQ